MAASLEGLCSPAFPLSEVQTLKGHSYLPRFTDGKVEAQRGWRLAQGHIVSRGEIGLKVRFRGKVFRSQTPAFSEGRQVWKHGFRDLGSMAPSSPSARLPNRGTGLQGVTTSQMLPTLLHTDRGSWRHGLVLSVAMGPATSKEVYLSTLLTLIPMSASRP